METNHAPWTVASLLDKYERETIPSLAPSTQKNYRRHVVHLKLWFGDRVAEELRPKDFGPFLDKKGKGRIQRIKQLAVLSACFTQAVSVWYLIERNVLRDVKRPNQLPRDRLITDEEFAACKAMAPLRIRLAMELALITGQRQGDIVNFKWSDIKPGTNGDELHVYQTKTRKRMAIAITPQLEAVLDRCWQLPKRGEYVLTKRGGGKLSSEGIRSGWQFTHRRWLKSGGASLHFHDIRALCATKLGSLELAQALLGHSSPQMTRRVYRRGVEHVQPLQL